MPSGDFQPIINSETIIHVVQESEDFFRASFAEDHNPFFFSTTGKTQEDRNRNFQ
jgi:hypothetical protein